MRKKNYIWVLLDTEETDSVYPTLNDVAINEIASKIYPALEDPDDPEASKSVEELADTIKHDILDNGEDCVDYSVFRIKRYSLCNERGEEYFSETELKRGDTVFELAGEYKFGGCDQAYARVPLYFSTQRPSQEGPIQYEGQSIISIIQEHEVK